MMFGKCPQGQRTARWARTLLGAATLFAASGVTAQSFTNPVLPSGPDPWVARDGKTYYLMVTRVDRLTIRKTRDITRVAEAPEVTVWTPPATGPNAHGIWAPELHRIGGKWFIYYTASPSGQDDNLHRGVFVLENDGPDPTRGRWIDRGRVNTQHSAIDGTVFAYGGKRYFVYSQSLGSESQLVIAQMRNPWTLTGPEVVISKADRDWERHIYPINEGPEFLAGPKGELFLTYSASACTSDDYVLGLLSAPAGSDPLNPRAWTKSPDPVLTKDPGPGVGVFGTGHNGFFTSPDGKQNWIVFHANPGPSRGCTSNRGTWIAPFTFGADGKPVFQQPSGPQQQLTAPSGQTIQQASR
jgi:GH43 family beta-xylosidase